MNHSRFECPFDYKITIEVSEMLASERITFRTLLSLLIRLKEYFIVG